MEQDQWRSTAGIDDQHLRMQSSIVSPDLQSLPAHGHRRHPIGLHCLRGDARCCRLSTAKTEDHQTLHVDSTRIDSLRRCLTLRIRKRGAFDCQSDPCVASAQVIADSFGPHGMVCLIMPWYVRRRFLADLKMSRGWQTATDYCYTQQNRTKEIVGTARLVSSWMEY